MRLSEIQHQERALALLRRGFDSGRIHHAYLFEGPDGVGKQTAAAALAARLLCHQSDTPGQAGLFGGEVADTLDPCGTCESCRLLEGGNHPDYQLIQRSLNKLHPDRTIRNSKGLFIVVELIRHFLIEPSTLKPALGHRRVYVIAEAERMNEAAQNALLKTLEEPPGETVLILVTSSADRLLPTIRSRCQRVPFDLLPEAFVSERLQALAGLDPPAAQTLARLSGGRLGEALRWHRLELLALLPRLAALLVERRREDPETFGSGLVELATELGGRMQALPGDLALAEDEEDGGSTSRSAGKSVPTDILRDAMKLTLMLAAACYRDALLVQHDAHAALAHVSPVASQVRALAGRQDSEACLQAVTAVSEAEHMLDRNVAVQLAAERLGVALGA